MEKLIFVVCFVNEFESIVVLFCSQLACNFSSTTSMSLIVVRSNSIGFIVLPTKNIKARILTDICRLHHDNVVEPLHKTYLFM
jgi:hypothetical protein